jgi:hypothetical protein
MKRMLLVAIIVVGFAMSGFATVDAMYINRLTHEYQFTDGRCAGWIGWESVPEGQTDLMKRACIREGYSEMNFPYQIEISVVVAALVIAMLVRRFAAGSIRRNR